MTKEPRVRLLSGARVTSLVMDEIRLAQKEGRAIDPREMQIASDMAQIALKCEVVQYNLRQTLRRLYR
jgi:hypothetical protein